MDYIKSKSDKVYDRILRNKIRVPEEKLDYPELKDGLSRHKYMQLVRRGGNHLSLDEWADKFNCTPSTVIEHLQQATPKKDRAAAAQEVEKNRLDHYLRGETMSEEVELNIKVRPKTILAEISTQELLKELSRRNKNDFLSDGRVKQADDSIEDPRDQLPGS